MEKAVWISRVKRYLLWWAMGMTLSISLTVVSAQTTELQVPKKPDHIDGTDLTLDPAKPGEKTAAPEAKMKLPALDESLSRLGEVPLVQLRDGLSGLQRLDQAEFTRLVAGLRDIDGNPVVAEAIKAELTSQYEKMVKEQGETLSKEEWLDKIQLVLDRRNQDKANGKNPDADDFAKRLEEMLQAKNNGQNNNDRLENEALKKALDEAQKKLQEQAMLRGMPAGPMANGDRMLPLPMPPLDRTGMGAGNLGQGAGQTGPDAGAMSGSSGSGSTATSPSSPSTDFPRDRADRKRSTPDSESLPKLSSSSLNNQPMSGSSMFNPGFSDSLGPKDKMGSSGASSKVLPEIKPPNEEIKPPVYPKSLASLGQAQVLNQIPGFTPSSGLAQANVAQNPLNSPALGATPTAPTLNGDPFLSATSAQKAGPINVPTQKAKYNFTKTPSYLSSSGNEDNGLEGAGTVGNSSDFRTLAGVGIQSILQMPRRQTGASGVPRGRSLFDLLKLKDLCSGEAGTKVTLCSRQISAR